MHEAMVATMLVMRVKASDTQEMITRIKIDLEKNTALEDIVSEIKNAMSSGCSRRQGDQSLTLRPHLRTRRVRRVWQVIFS